MLLAVVVVSVRAFAIEAGGAEVKLNEFSTQSGLQVLFDYGVIRGHSTRAVHGTLDPFVALDQMIAGTRIQYEFINQRTVTLRLAPAPSGPELVGGYLYSQGGWYYSCVPLMPFGIMGYSAKHYRELKIAIGLGQVPPDQLYCVPDAPVNPEEPVRDYVPSPDEIAVTVKAKRKPPHLVVRRNK